MDRDLSSSVVCHAGYSGCDYPHAVQWNGTRLDVIHIIREWCQPGSKAWQVRTAQGTEFLLSCYEGDDQWTVTEVIRK